MEDVSNSSRFNKSAPGVRANTTHGERSLAHDKGQWLILFYRPADFTPVCTNEFIACAKASAKFESVNCALLVLSIDSI